MPGHAPEADILRMAQAASRIVTMLPSTPQVEAVYLDDAKGILSGLLSLPKDTPALPSPESSADSSSSPFHTILIDQTTLDPTAAMAVAARVHAETQGGVAMLDAPVSGGKLPWEDMIGI
jgi:3-hydroxyisobutyrate dehydrogenase